VDVGLGVRAVAGLDRFGEAVDGVVGVVGGGVQVCGVVVGVLLGGDVFGFVAVGVPGQGVVVDQGSAGGLLGLGVDLTGGPVGGVEGVAVGLGLAQLLAAGGVGVRGGFGAGVGGGGADLYGLDEFAQVVGVGGVLAGVVDGGRLPVRVVGVGRVGLLRTACGLGDFGDLVQAGVVDAVAIDRCAG